MRYSTEQTIHNDNYMLYNEYNEASNHMSIVDNRVSITRRT